MVARLPWPAASAPPRSRIAPSGMADLTAADARALLGRAAEHRDRAAFAELYRHYSPRVRAWLVRRGARGSEVDELVHEVMLAVWQQAGRYDAGRASVSTWVFTIARNRHVDRIRKHARPEPEPDDPQFVPSAPAPADDALAKARAAERVREAIAALPDAQAQVMRRAWLDGVTLRQVAEEQGVPLGTVKSRVRLAMKSLRSTLATEAAR